MQAKLAISLGSLALIAVAAGAGADARSNALVKRASAVATKSGTLTADLVMTMTGKDRNRQLKGRVELKRPNQGSLVLTGPDGKPIQTAISTGTEAFMVIHSEKQYLKLPDGVNAGASLSMAGPAAEAFMRGKLPAEFSGGKLKYTGSIKRDGRSYQVVSLLGRREPFTSGKLYFGPSGLLEGVEQTMKFGGDTIRQSQWLKNIKLGTPMPEGRFAFTPPEGFTIYEQSSPDAKLLAVGANAPDFRLAQPQGGELALSDYIKDRKATVINFWFYG